MISLEVNNLEGIYLLANTIARNSKRASGLVPCLMPNDKQTYHNRTTLPKAIRSSSNIPLFFCHCSYHSDETLNFGAWWLTNPYKPDTFLKVDVVPLCSSLHKHWRTLPLPNIFLSNNLFLPDCGDNNNNRCVLVPWSKIDWQLWLEKRAVTKLISGVDPGRMSVMPLIHLFR